MGDNFEYKGNWFLPKEPNNRVNGILKYDKVNGISLELFGGFKENNRPGFGEETIILGTTSDSKSIALYKCSEKSIQGLTFVSNSELGTPMLTYSARYIFEGVHFYSGEEIKFNTIISEINNLDQWVGISGFLPQDSAEIKKNYSQFVYALKYKLPEPIKFTINSKIEGEFNFVGTSPSTREYDQSQVFKQSTQVIFRSKSVEPFNSLLDILFTFQKFLIFALYAPTSPTHIKLEGDFADFGTNEKRKRKVRLYFFLSNIFDDKPRASRFDMVFNYFSIKTNFQTIIKNWFELHDKIKPAFNLLIEQFYNDLRFNENTFLNLAQAAETFHAKTSNHSKMPKADYEAMKASIMASSDAKYYDWLTEQFSFGNNLTLNTRLQELVSKYSIPVLDELIGNKDVFVSQVRKSRNYYTHYSKKGENVLEGSALFYLTEKLKILLVCSILIEAGVDKDTLQASLKRNSFRLFYGILLHNPKVKAKTEASDKDISGSESKNSKD